jgi:hypothetical protein
LIVLIFFTPKIPPIFGKCSALSAISCRQKRPGRSEHCERKMKGIVGHDKSYKEFKRFFTMYEDRIKKIENTLIR